jgi:RNase P subunit RPR2
MKTKLNILSIDSGGVRNIISAYILQKVEEKLQEAQNIPELRIGDVFDTFISVGSGTLLSYLYQIPNSSGKYKDSKSVLNKYVKSAKTIYKRKHISYLPFRTTYCNNNALIKQAEYLLNYKKKVKKSKNNIVPLFNLTKGNLEIINSIKSNLSIEEIVKASLATYPFFKEVVINDIQYSSGENLAANPKFCLNEPLLKMTFDDYDVVNVLSIGAGSNTIYSSNNRIKKIVIDCATQYMEEFIINNEKINYFRIDVPTKDFDTFNPLHTNSYIDFSSLNVKSMITAGQLAMGALEIKQFNRFIKKLV